MFGPPVDASAIRNPFLHCAQVAEQNVSNKAKACIPQLVPQAPLNFTTPASGSAIAKMPFISDGTHAMSNGLVCVELPV
jgi:hypothetical protein